MAGTGKTHLRNSPDVLLSVNDLVVEFPVARTGLKVNAVSGISFDVIKGETLGIVGESGCGKSTTGRAIMQLPAPTSGSIDFNGQELTTLSKDDMRDADQDSDDLSRSDFIAEPATKSTRHRFRTTSRLEAWDPRRARHFGEQDS